MYKILFLLMSFFMLSAHAADRYSLQVSKCQRNCDPDLCESYSIEKALECLEDCAGDSSQHAKDVTMKCQKHVSQLLEEPEHHNAHPNRTNAGKWEPVPEMTPCEQHCDPDSCKMYSLEKAQDCLAICEESSPHANKVHHLCQVRVDQLMTQEQQRVVFPDACGKATKDHAVQNFVPMEGLIISQGATWKFRHFIPGRGGPISEIDFTISPKVGEIGTGRANGDSPLLTRTPDGGWRVMAHVDMDKKTVMCLSQAYKP